MGDSIFDVSILGYFFAGCNWNLNHPSRMHNSELIQLCINEHCNAFCALVKSFGMVNNFCLSTLVGEIQRPEAVDDWGTDFGSMTLPRLIFNNIFSQRSERFNRFYLTLGCC